MIIGEVELSVLIKVVGQIGVIAVLLCVYVWQFIKEKQAMSQRITDVENFRRDEISRMVRETTEALAHSTKAIEDNRRVVEHNSHVMEKLCRKIDGQSNSRDTLGGG